MIPFVGRQQEQALLVGAWQRVRAGGAAHVLMRGEAGVGKTRLADELGARVRADGGRVLRGRCWELGGAPAYWPWIQAFGSFIDETGEAALAPLLRDVAAALGPGLGTALVRLLPRLRAAFPAPLAREDVGGEAAERRLLQAVAVLLGRLGADRPLLLVLDDLEAADLPSVLLLQRLMGGGAGASMPPGAPAATDAASSAGAGAWPRLPLLLLALHRTPLPADAAAAPALASIAQEPAVAALGLGGLSHGEIAQMMSAVTGGPTDEPAAVAVHARTGGNPLFASELIRLQAVHRADAPSPSPSPSSVPVAPSSSPSPSPSPSWPLPSGIRGVIEQRLAMLPAGCRRLLEIGALAGRQVDLDLLAEVAGGGAEAVAAALAPALASAELLPVRGRPLAYAFAHPLIRDCLYESIPAAARARLHGRFGDVLCARHAGALDEHLDVVASHYVAALPVGWAPQALDLCRRAARRAAGLGARDECVRLLLLALDALPAIGRGEAGDADGDGDGDGDRGDRAGQLWCDLSLELAEAQDRAGRVRDARATFMRVAEQAERAGQVREFGRAAVGYGGRFIWARPTGDAREVPMLERAFAALGGGDPALRALLLARKSVLRRDHGGGDAILAGCRQAAELARGAGDAAAVTQTLGALIFALGCFGTIEECLTAIDRLAAAARATGDLEQTVQATIYRAACLLESGEPGGAEAELAACERLEQTLGQPVQRWLRRFSYAEIAFFRGQLADAERHGEEARRIGQELGRPESAAIHLCALYLTRREQGRLAEIEPMVVQARAQLSTFPIARCLPGHLAGEVGRLAEAREFLDRHLETDFAELLDSSTQRMTLGLLVETAARTGHAPAAAALARLLAGVTRRYLSIPGTAIVGPTSRFRGLLAATARDWSDAARLLREAAAECRRAGAACWALRCDLDLAAILVGERGAGDPSRARGLLAAVIARAEAAGFGGVAADARSLRDSLGGDGAPAGPRDSAGGGPDLPPVAAPTPPAFRREGELWTIVFAGARVRLRDGKGLRYLAELLARAGEPLPVVALAGRARQDQDGDDDDDGDDGDAPPRSAPPTVDGASPLSGPGRASFQQRLQALDAEIEESARWNDLARAERARREREELATELAAAMGLGGGANRRARAPAERARHSVTKAIKTAIRQIAVEHADLGRHLESTVRTGLYCCYQPDPLNPPGWRVQS